MTDDKKVLMITKIGCPYCERAKVVLNEALGGKYNDQIELFVRESDEQRFAELKEKYRFLTVPTFIDKKTGAVLSDSQKETITEFMKEATGF
ncbi:MULTISPECIES: glutaredoxin family protein [unclassified Sporolactobacillus]|uniref:glutaredoxin family protein n=1 Tax=unclassified Sporolactobacillus TaxID=2628533 RepID=UPI002367B19B|nr:glutathione S-transferase N-terminal domain-containing protein [Sporolactobacillus sp. CQH2019]MDD9147463.1 glutathione S-transferase N-terminal domain-containing protein [Sporolactobacillus sp. CQH2019]